MVNFTRAIVCLTVLFLAVANGQITNPLKSRLRCGIAPDVPGFGFREGNTYTGIEAEFCKAFATALTGSANNAVYVPTLSSNRFQLVFNNSIDIITRGTFPSFTRETVFNVLFTHPYIWDYGGIVVLADSGIQDVSGIGAALSADGSAKICVNAGSLNREQAMFLFGANSVIELPTTTDAFNGVTNGNCIGYINTVGNLYGVVSQTSDRNLYRVIELGVSTIDQYAFAVKKNRRRLHETLNWVVSGLVLASHENITQANVDNVQARLNTLSEDAKRMLGYDTTNPQLPRTYVLEGSYLRADTMTKVIKAVGNWDEMFQRTVARIGTPIGKNKPIAENGLLWAYRW